MTLHEWGLFHKTDKATAHNYLHFYEARIGKPKSILEFGVRDGASLKMWRDAFPTAMVMGFDINPPIAINGVITLQVDCTEAMPGDQEYDLIIDDASHITVDQIKTFNNWWAAVVPGGYYILEDIHAAAYDLYNPTHIDFDAWVKSLGIMYEYFWRDPNDKSDSGTVIFYK